MSRTIGLVRTVSLSALIGSCCNEGHVVGVLTQTCVSPATAVSATTTASTASMQPPIQPAVATAAPPSIIASAYSPQFCWGELDASAFTERLNRAYSVVVHWRRNIFNIPSGNADTDFVRELSRLFRAYAKCSSLESIALKAAMTLCVLLLQKPSRTSKSRTTLLV